MTARARDPRLALKAIAHADAVRAREWLGRVTFRIKYGKGPLTLTDWLDVLEQARHAEDNAHAIVTLAELMARVEAAGEPAVIRVGDRRFELEAATP